MEQPEQGKTSILFVDDEDVIRQSFAHELRMEGFVITSYSIHYTKLYDDSFYGRCRRRNRRQGISQASEEDQSRRDISDKSRFAQATDAPPCL